MPRVKEFDEAEVLDQALELFRARGFKHTSFADLVDVLGVSRQSLYDTYGDKQTLYQTALQRYLDRALDGIRRRLADDAPIRDVLGGLFDGIVAGGCSKGSPGCFMVNSMVELSPHDADIRQIAEKHAHEIQGLLAARLTTAQRQGEIAKSKDPAALARYFYHTILGISVASRALNDKESLKETGHLALQVLD